MTYTVLNRHGEKQADGLNIEEAAAAVMNYDGHEYEIRPCADGDGYVLWTSPCSRNSGHWRGLVPSVIFSLSNDIDIAPAEICRDVIQRAHWWLSQEVITDDEYAARMANANADDDR